MKYKHIGLLGNLYFENSQGVVAVLSVLPFLFCRCGLMVEKFEIAQIWQLVFSTLL